jgi:hypothetical protein
LVVRGCVARARIIVARKWVCLAAAQAVGRAQVRRAHKGLIHYHDLPRGGFDRAILGYLDTVTERAGLAAFRRVAEPWERAPPDDGTWALARERALRSGDDKVALLREARAAAKGTAAKGVAKL